MQKIVEHIYVGTVDEVPFVKDFGWSILGACKEPLHRQNARLRGADKDGYSSKAMPKNEPEYLWAERKHALYCNLIDSPSMKYIPDEIIQRCIQFINVELAQRQNILVVCNKAESRSPSIVFMWLITEGWFNYTEKFSVAFIDFAKMYTKYNPGKGFLDYVQEFWKKYNWLVREIKTT